jgi:hypothetical protein
VDKLSAPLGQGMPEKGRKLPVAGLAGLLGLFGLVAVGWVLFADNPLDGKRVAVESSLSARRTDAEDGKHQTGYDRQKDFMPPTRATADKEVPPPDAKIVTIIDGSNGQRQTVILRPTPGFAPAR